MQGKVKLILLKYHFFMQPESETTVEQDSLFEGFSADDKGKIILRKKKGNGAYEGYLIEALAIALPVVNYSFSASVCFC